MVPRTISTVLPGLKVTNFAAVCPRFVWRKKTPSNPVGFVVLNPPLWPGQDRAVAPGLVRQLTRGLTVLAQRYRQTDRCPWLADTSPAFMGSHLLKAGEVSTVKCVSLLYSTTFRSPYSRLCDYKVRLDLNGQEKAFSLQCSRFSRKWFLNNLILAEHVTVLKNKGQTWCHLLFYFTSYVLNMFRTLIYP